MAVEDIAPVFHLGRRVFDARRFPTLHRTWDPYEVASQFVSEGDLSLVAAEDGRVVGFCLGTTVEKPDQRRPDGYLIWLGVAEKSRRRGVARKLMAELVRRMRECGVKMILLETEDGDTPAVAFFHRMGFGTSRFRQVWMCRALGRAVRGRMRV